MGILRLLLALSVLGSHVDGGKILCFRFLNGELAVQAFYMISGFYMALVLNEKYRPGEYFAFLQQRYLRLYPLYILLVLLTLGSEGFVSWYNSSPEGIYKVWDSYGSILNPFSALTLLFTNIFILGQDAMMFLGVNPSNGAFYFTPHWFREFLPAQNFLIITPAWTLGVELLFYFCAPYFVRRPWPFQLTILLISTCARVAAYLIFDWKSDPWSYRFFPFELAFFMAGSLAYQVYRTNRGYLKKGAPFIHRWKWILYFAIAVYGYRQLPLDVELRYFLFIGILFLLLPFLFFTTKELWWDRLLGELSYPFYLSHPLVLFWFGRVMPMRLPAPYRGAIDAILVLAFSFLLYQFFESRIENYRHRLFAFKRTQDSKENKI